MSIARHSHEADHQHGAAAPDIAIEVGAPDKYTLDESQRLLPEEVDYLLAHSAVRRMLRTVGFKGIVPARLDKLSKKQRNLLHDKRDAIAATRSMWHRIWTAIAKTIAYFQIENFRLIILTNGPKGGSGKTIIVLYLGAWVRAITGIVPVLLAATEARTNNTAGRHVGVPVDSPLNVLRHSGFTNRRKAGQFTTPGELLSAIYPADCGVQVILEDKANTRKPVPTGGNAEAKPTRQVDYPPEDFEGDADILNWAGSRCIILDGAQDGIEYGSIPYVAARIATAMLSVGRFEDKLSLELMGRGMGDFLSWDETTPLEEGKVPQDGRHYPTDQKVRDSVVCITNVPTGVTPEFEPYVGNLGSHHTAVHHDSYMYNEAGRFVRSVDRNAISEWTVMELLELLVQLCEVSAKTLGLDDSHIKAMPTVTSGYHPQNLRIDDLGRPLPKPDYAMQKPPAELARDLVFSANAAQLVQSVPVAPSSPPPEAAPMQYGPPPPVAQPQQAMWNPPYAPQATWPNGLQPGGAPMGQPPYVPTGNHQSTPTPYNSNGRYGS
jgi:hypothetical protein